MNKHQLINQERNKSAKARPIYDTRTNEISGYGIPDRNTSANVPHMVYVRTEVLENFEDEEHCFQAIRSIQKTGLMPRMGSQSKPLSPYDLELYERNLSIGERHFQWIQETSYRVRKSTGYDSVWGYGYVTGNGFVIVGRDDEPIFTVED